MKIMITLSDNNEAKEKYNWEPTVDINEGLRKVCEYQCELLSRIDKKEV